MSEIRHDPISGHSVIIAPDRSRRASDFRLDRPRVSPEDRCPFCPGHESETPAEVFTSSSETGGWQTRVFPNLFPALPPEIGGHEVIVEAPGHHDSLADASVSDVAKVVHTWQARFLHYKQDPRIRSAVLFKNHGPAAGATREHPHSQLMAMPFVPPRVERELAAATRQASAGSKCPWCDEVERAGERLVLATRHFAVLSPYAARFAYETWIVPLSHESHFELAADDVLLDLAGALRETLSRIEKVLDAPPFNAEIMTAPLNEKPTDHYHWRMEIIPRLGNLAGFEWASGCYINPAPPEEVSRRLAGAGAD